MAESMIDMLPGTEIMKGAGKVYPAHAHDNSDSQVLVPRPSNDLHDPLNWSPRWKYIVVASQAAFVFISQVGTLSIAPLSPTYEREWNKNATQVALFTGATVLALGYANFVIIPCSDVFGRRIVLLISALISLGAYIWQALATSYSSFIGARILVGIGAASNESIMPVVIADIFFLHERGKWMGIYFALYNAGTYIGPIISGAVGERTTWRWFFWACAISQGIVLIILVFTFPESRRTDFTSLSSPLLSGMSPSHDEGILGHAEEKTTQSLSPRGSLSYPGQEHLNCRGGPVKSQFGFFLKPDRQALRHVFRHIITPFQIFFFPIVGWAALTFGMAADSLLLVNLLQSPAFSAPPYNFASQSEGFTNFALLAGTIFAMVVAGPWSDWVAMRATERNDGIREPEMRLPALIPFVALYILGMTVIGVGWAYGWPWESIVVVGFSLVGCACTAIMAMTITYAVDSYKPIAGQIMVVSTVAKNTFGFGETYWVNNLAATHGFVRPFMILLGLEVGLALIGIALFAYFGKRMRQFTKNAAVHSF